MSNETITHEQAVAVVSAVSDHAKCATACALLGHSRIVTTCFGYVSCARCGEQVADSLGSTWSNADECVIVGHNCENCLAAYAKLTWQDKFLSPEPLVEGETPAQAEERREVERRA